MAPWRVESACGSRATHRQFSLHSRWSFFFGLLITFELTSGVVAASERSRSGGLLLIAITPTMAGRPPTWGRWGRCPSLLPWPALARMASSHGATVIEVTG